MFHVPCSTFYVPRSTFHFTRFKCSVFLSLDDSAWNLANVLILSIRSDLGTIYCTWHEPSVKFWIHCGWELVNVFYSFSVCFFFLYFFGFCCSILTPSNRITRIIILSVIDRFIWFYICICIIFIYLYSVIHSCIKRTCSFYLLFDDIWWSFL